MRIQGHGTLLEAIRSQWRPSLCAQNVGNLRKEIHLMLTNIINTVLVPDLVLGLLNRK